MSSEQADMLHGVGAADAARVIALASRVLVATGAQLFDLGAEAHDVYLIERGRIALHAADADRHPERGCAGRGAYVRPDGRVVRADSASPLPR